jgi:IS30 family transposase
MRTFKHNKELILELHYKNKSREQIVKILKEKERIDISVEDVKETIKLHELGEIE